MWQASYPTTLNFKIAGVFPILSPDMMKRLQPFLALTQICAARVCWRVKRGGYHVNQYWLKMEKTSILHSASLQSVKSAAAPVCASHVSYMEIRVFSLQDKCLVIFEKARRLFNTSWWRYFQTLLTIWIKTCSIDCTIKMIFNPFPKF